VVGRVAFGNWSSGLVRPGGPDCAGRLCGRGADPGNRGGQAADDLDSCVRHHRWPAAVLMPQRPAGRPLPASGGGSRGRAARSGRGGV